MKYKKKIAKLEARQKRYDEMSSSDRTKYHHQHRPGSLKK